MTEVSVVRPGFLAAWKMAKAISTLTACSDWLSNWNFTQSEPSYDDMMVRYKGDGAAQLRIIVCFQQAPDLLPPDGDDDDDDDDDSEGDRDTSAAHFP